MAFEAWGKSVNSFNRDNPFSITSIAQLKNKAAKFVEELNNRDKLSAFYRFVFNYAKPSSHRHLETDTAIRYWKLILDRFFSNERDNRLQKWYMFLQCTGVKAITQDTWNLFLLFLWETNAHLSNYDFETGPW